MRGIGHEAPLVHGDTLYAESTVLGKETLPDKPDRGAVEVETRGLNQHGTVILTFTRTLEVPVGRHPLGPTGAHAAWPFTGDTMRRSPDRSS